MSSRIDEAGHTKAFDYPVAEHWGKAEMFSSAGGTRTDNTSGQSRPRYQLSHPEKKNIPGRNNLVLPAESLSYTLIFSWSAS